MLVLDSAVLLAVVVSVSAWQNKDPWFDQWNETDRYLASDGNIVRMPLRLASQEMVLYGGTNVDCARAVVDSYCHFDEY